MPRQTLTSVTQYAFFVCIFIAFFPSISAAQKIFEGVVSYRVTSPKASNDITIYSKYALSKIKLTMTNKEVQFVFDRENQKIVMIVPDDKVYTIQTLKGETKENKPNSLVSNQKQETQALPQLTGKTKKILGYECEQWLETNSQGTTEIWLTREIGTLNALSILSDSGTPKSAAGMGVRMIGGVFLPVTRGIKLNEYFPLQIIHYSPQGQTVSSVEATSLQAQTLDNSIFQPPANFQKGVGSE